VRVKSFFGLAALIALTMGSTGFGQAPSAGAPTGDRIAVIDVAYIFEHHPSFKQRISDVDAKMKVAEEEINKRREDLLNEASSLKNYDPKSTDYKQREEMVAAKESQLKLDFMRREKEFVELKAAIAFEAYQELRTVVKGFCESNRISMVIRCSREEMDPKKPMTVSSGINKDVVYYSPTIDMTDPVLKYLTESRSATPTPQAPINTASPVRPGVKQR
jgi:Skp family chaperone for outer membrane proteins